MSTLTKQQWQAIDKRLQSLYDNVELECDGYKVWLGLRRISQFKNAITVYVNGEFLGKWIVDQESEERRRFLPVLTFSLYTQKQKQAAIKAFGKRMATKYGFTEKGQRVGFCWTSFRSLKSHLLKHNESIKYLNENDNAAGN